MFYVPTYFTKPMLRIKKMGTFAQLSSVEIHKFFFFKLRVQVVTKVL